MDVCRMAESMKALADPNRVSVMEMLIEGEMTVGQMQRQLNVTQSTLSHHLKLLSNIGMLESRRQGVWRYYRLNIRMLRAMGEFFISCADYGEKRRQGQEAERPVLPMAEELQEAGL